MHFHRNQLDPAELGLLVQKVHAHLSPAIQSTCFESNNLSSKLFVLSHPTEMGNTENKENC